MSRTYTTFVSLAVNFGAIFSLRTKSGGTAGTAKLGGTRARHRTLCFGLWAGNLPHLARLLSAKVVAGLVTRSGQVSRHQTRHLKARR
jgi:hypothetical protein